MRQIYITISDHRFGEPKVIGATLSMPKSYPIAMVNMVSQLCRSGSDSVGTRPQERSSSARAKVS
ncbi:hypothetical protein KY284_006150 [Solanum tuberosum]|nr:hypothetical protein KY284_006150 [Solanum tuberosum]